MNKDVINLINHGASTIVDIAQMTQYRIRYAQDGDKEAKQKMYKHAFLACAGIACLFTIGIFGLLESRNKY